MVMERGALSFLLPFPHRCSFLLLSLSTKTDAFFLSMLTCSLSLSLNPLAFERSRKVNKKEETEPFGRARFLKTSSVSFFFLSLLFILFFFFFSPIDPSIDSLSQSPKNATPNARTATPAGGPRRPGRRVRVRGLRRHGPRMGALVDDADRLARRPGRPGLAGGPRAAVGDVERRR